MGTVEEVGGDDIGGLSIDDFGGHGSIIIKMDNTVRLFVKIN
jgi:hypothetical protein